MEQARAHFSTPNHWPGFEMIAAMRERRRMRVLGLCALSLFFGLLFCGAIHGIVHPGEDEHSECLMAQCSSEPAVAPVAIVLAMTWTFVYAAPGYAEQTVAHAIARTRSVRGPPASAHLLA